MLNYYQTFLWPFLRARRYQLPSGVRQLYYVSAEDALWDLLAQKQVAKGGIILVPSFYCVDVVNNIEAHGFHVRFYDVDEHFQTSSDAFLAIVRQHQPVAVVMFHAAGITFQLCMPEVYAEVQRLKPGCLFIEDTVHRLTNPETISLYGQYHLIMDSLRKDSPLPGSNLYGQSQFLSFDPPRKYAWHWYRWLSLGWFMVFRAFFLTAALLHSPRLVRFAHERVLKIHDDLIGDVNTPPAGFAVFHWLHQFFDFAKVSRLKAAQVERYQELFKSAHAHTNLTKRIYLVRIPPHDFGQLHVFPLGVRLGAESSKIKSLLTQLQQRGIVIWAKFPDSPWSQERAVLFLPLGFHVSDKEIEFACSQLLNCLSSLKINTP